LFIQSCTSFYKTAEKTIKILNDFTLEIVKNRRKCLRSPEEEGFCVIDSIMQTPIDGRLLTDEEAGFEINSVILGNHDTMKTAMTFLFYVLAKYPDVQEKVYHEVVKTVIDEADHDLTIEDVEKLHYLESVIKETLRLYPVIPVVGRKLRSEKQIGELIFPKDVEVLISPYLMMRNPKYFDDPLTFNPERFLGVHKMPLAYSAFSIGARKCFGGRYAITSLKMIAAKFLIQNKLRLENDNQEIVVGVEMTLKPKQKILLKLEQRFK
jgi:cytochrome P450